MTATPILALDELASGQAIPETTVNEAIRWLEFFGAGGKVLDRGLTAEPGSPADGDAYLLPGSPTGTHWSGNGGKIALYISTAWEFKTAKEGMRLYVADEDITIVYDGSAWNNVAGTTYSDEAARDAIGAALVAGTGISISVNDGSDTITITNSAPSAGTYTDENAQDAVGSILTDSSTIDFTYNDGAGTITAAVISSAVKPTESLVIACSDESTAITTGTAKVTFRMPYAFTLSDVRASVNTAPTGSTIIIDINEGGSSILSTKLSIDASEKTSTTAATPVVISDASLADDAEITIDFDQVGSTIAGKGVKVVLIGTRT